MKKTIRKKLLAIIMAFMFAGMMGLSVTTSINGTDFSLVGIVALASGTSGGGSNVCEGNPCSSCAFVRDNAGNITGCECNDPDPYNSCNHTVIE